MFCRAKHGLPHPTGVKICRAGRSVLHVVGSIKAETPKVGAVVGGTVFSVRDFGAHIDLDGGGRGLLHRSQISHKRVEEAGSLLKQGDAVKVLVVAEDPETGRFSLSTKHLEASPGDMLVDPQRVYDGAEVVAAERRWQPQRRMGTVVSGRVRFVNDFRAVIDLDSGGTAALHRRQVSQNPVEDLGAVFSSGDAVKALVIAEELETGRIRLSTKVLEASPGDMLVDPQRVYDNAEVVAERWRQQLGTGTPTEWTPMSTADFESIAVWQLVEGVVTDVKAEGATVWLGSVEAWLPVRGVSGEYVPAMEQVVRPGDRVRALVSRRQVKRKRVDLNTKRLEMDAGDMLRNPQRVYDNAEEAAERWRQSLRNMAGHVVPFKIYGLLRGSVLCQVWEDVYGILPKEDVSFEEVELLEKVFPWDQQGKALVTGLDEQSGLLLLSTKWLEETPGDMLRDPEQVYANADRVESSAATKWRQSRAAAPTSEAGVAADSKAEEGEEAHLDSELKTFSVVEGVVTSLKPFGALVMLRNGQVGLIHRSQVSHERVMEVADIFKPGDKVKVMVLSVDPERGRICLSTKKLEPNPGDMLRDPQQVYDKAEETARKVPQSSLAGGQPKSPRAIALRLPRP